MTVALTMFPDQGQGAGQAMEDGAALAVVLPRGTRPEDVPQRLKLYFEFRYERCTKIQKFSQEAGKDAPDEKLDSTQSHDMRPTSC